MKRIPPHTFLLVGLAFSAAPAYAQITPDQSTATEVRGNTIAPTGAGTVNGGNLYHSFDRFNVPVEGVQFTTGTSTVDGSRINNILNRVTGDTPSSILGAIESRTAFPNANVFLMNPNGIVFGANARLDVAGSFTATTATGIGFAEQVFSASASKLDFPAGDPSKLIFSVSQPGAILNEGNLAVGDSSTIALVGGTVVSTGTLTAPGGNILLGAVPGDSVVELRSPNAVLGFTVAASQLPKDWNGTVADMPQLATLLTGSVPQADKVVVLPDGTLSLIDSKSAPMPGAVPVENNTTVVSGTLDARGNSNQTAGGTIGLFGQKVGVVAAEIDVSGIGNGGTVLIGGDYLGAGTVPNAQFTYVAPNSVIRADAGTLGNGGRVIVWSDVATTFGGLITARGGTVAGDGGFVETSGKVFLNALGGQVLAGATNGLPGTWLLDPTNIVVTNFDNNPNFPSTPPFVFVPDDAAVNSQIGAPQIVAALNQGANVEILTTSAASGLGNITFFNATVNKTSGGAATLTLRADNNIIFTGSTFTSTSGSLSLDLFAANNVDITGTTIAGAVDTPAFVNINAQNGSIRLFTATISASTAPVDVRLTAADLVQTSGLTATTAGGLVSFRATTFPTSLINVTGGTIDTRNPSGTGGQVSFISDGGVNLTLAPIFTGGGAATFSANETLGITSSLTPINAGSGTLTLSGNEIDLFGTGGVVTGTGTVIIKPTNPDQIVSIGQDLTFDGNGSGALDFTLSDLSVLGSGFSRYIFGNEAGDQTTFIDGTVAFDGAVEFRAPGSSGRILVTSGSVIDSNSSITFRAGGDIRVADNVSIGTTLSAPIPIVFNSDADGNGEGAILIDGSSDGVFIFSRGGNITLGGGSDPLINPAVGFFDIDLGISSPGVSILGADIDAQGGNISIRGQGGISPGNRGTTLENTLLTTTGAGTIGIFGEGVLGAIAGLELIDDVDIISTGSGTITLTGTVGAGSANSSGILINNGNLIQGFNGNVLLNGSATNGTFSNNGILSRGDIETTGTGSITITGLNSSTGTLNSGVTIGSSGRVVSTSGTVSIAGTSSGTTGSQGINLNEATIESLAGGTIALSGVGTQEAVGTRIFDGTIQTALGGATVITGESVNNAGVLLTTSSTGQVNIGTSGGDLTVRAVTTNPAEVGLALVPGGGSFFLTTTLGGGNGNVLILSDRTSVPAGLTDFFSTGSGTFQIQPVSSSIPLAIGGTNTFVSDNFLENLGITNFYGSIVVGGQTINNPITLVNSILLLPLDPPNPGDNVSLTFATGNTINTGPFSIDTIVNSTSVNTIRLFGGAGVTVNNILAPTENLGIFSPAGTVQANGLIGVRSLSIDARDGATLINVSASQDIDINVSAGNLVAARLLALLGDLTVAANSFTLNQAESSLSIALTGVNGGTVLNGSSTLGPLTINTGTNPVNLNGVFRASSFDITSAVINAGNGLAFVTSPGIDATIATPIVGTSSSNVTFFDDFGGGTFTLAGAIGTVASPIGSVSFFGDTIAISAPVVAENITFGNSSFTLAADLTATGQLTVDAPVTVTGDRTITAEAITISSLGTLAGTGNLVLQPFNPNTSIGLGDGAPGDFNLDGTEIAAIQNGFASITFGRSDGTGLISLGTATFQDPVTFRSPGSTGLNLGGNLSGIDNVAFTFDVPVTLTADSSVDAPGDIVFNQPVNGAFSLTPQSTGGQTIFNAPVGNTTPLAGLTVAGNQTVINGSVAAGFINLFGATNLNGNLTANGLLTIDVPVTVTGDRTLTAAEITISSSGSLIGSGNLVLQPVNPASSIGLGDGAPGDFNLDGTELAALQNGFASITFGRSDGTGLITLGTATFQDPVTFRSPGSTGLNLAGILSGIDDVAFTFDVPVNLTTDSAVFTNTGAIVFNQTVNGNFNLTTQSTSGQTIFNASVGNTTPLAGLTVAGNQTVINGSVAAGFINLFGTTNLNASLTTSGLLTIDVPVTVTGDRTLTAAEITISSSGSLIGTGNLVLQPVNPASSIGLGDGAPGDFNLNGSELAAIQDGFASLTFGRGDGSGLITLGTATFQDPVTFRSPGSSGLNLAGNLSGIDDVAFTFDVPVTLTADSSVTVATGTIVFNQPVNGGFDLTTSSFFGRTIFNAPVGNTQPLTSLLLSGNEVELNSTVRAGLVNFFADAFLNADVTADVRVGIDSVVTITGDRTITAGTIDFSTLGSLRGTGNLVLQPVNPASSIGLGDGAPGDFNLNGSELAAIQDGFASLTFGRADGSGLITLGTATFQDPVTFRSPGSSGLNLAGILTGIDNVAFTFNVPVTLTADSVVATNSGAVIFNGSVNGGFDLGVQAGGSVQVNGAIGSTTPLTGLDISGETVQINAPVTVTNDVTLTSDSGTAIASSVSLNAGQSINFFGSAPGSEVEFVGNTITASQIFISPPTKLFGDLTLAVAGNALFSSTLDGAFTLTVPNPTTSLIFGNPVGETVPLAQLVVNPQARILGREFSPGVFAPISIRTTGDVTVGSILNSGADISVTSEAGNITTNGQTVSSDSLFGSGGAVTLRSVSGAIATGNITANGITDGGDILVDAKVSITVGQVTSIGFNGSGGNIILDPEGDVVFGAIASVSGSSDAGGDITIVSTGGNVRGLETFSFTGCEGTTLCSVGGAGGGTISIQTGGLGSFFVGLTPSQILINGTVGVLRSGSTIIPLGTEILSTVGQTFRQGGIAVTPGSLAIPVLPPPITSPGFPSGEPPISSPGDVPISDRITLLPPLPPPVIDGTAVPQIPPGADLKAPLLAIARNQLEVGNLGAAFESLERAYVSELSAYGNEVEASNPITIEQSQNLLSAVSQRTGSATALIYPVIVDNRLEILVIPPSDRGTPFRRFFPNLTAERIEAVLNDYRSGLRDTGSRDYLEPAAQLYDWIMRPINDELQQRKIETLVFVMDSGLRVIPPAALYDRTRQQFVLEQYTTVTIPSLRLTRLEERDRNNTRILAFGLTEAVQGFSALPAVRTEVETITSKVLSGRAFFNESFTINNLQQQRQSENFGIIHLATHAQFLDETPRGIFVQLWSERLPGDRIPRLRFDRPSVEMLTLSACETAVGSNLGLGGLLVESGARSVLASLWTVSDAGTAPLMIRFYQDFVKAPTKAIALRNAQLALLRGQVKLEGNVVRGIEGVGDIILPELTGEIDLRHPFFWSSFLLVGNWF